MQKLPVVLLLLLLAFAGLPTAAQEPLGTTVQTVNGSIAVPTRFTNPEQGFPGLGRRLWLLHPATNGTAMYVFEVDPASWGGAFTITNVSDATGEADLDIYFYEDFGTVGALLTGDPGLPVSTAEYGARGAGGDTGFIPPKSRYGIVFTYNGVQSVFTYNGYEMPTISLAGGNLDLTVPAGAFVGWVNDTEDYAFVRRTKQPWAFDSGSGTASGLRKGEVFTMRFEEEGTYAYETSTGLGTITVVAGPGPGTPAN